MHAVLITFELLVDFDDVRPMFQPFVRSLGQVDGLVSTTWMVDGSTVTLVQLFTSSGEADGYLASRAVEQLASDPVCADFYVERYETVDELTHQAALQPETAYA